MLTAAVIARDEAANIERCLAALAWADERLVLVDAATADSTEDLARAAGARTARRRFVNFAEQRNAALDLATTEWVLFVDADEVVTPRLAEEIRATLAERVSADAPVGYWIPRKNIICGRWVRHAGWYPDAQLRLLRRERARYDAARPVHEIVLLDGSEGQLRELLVHHNYQSLTQFRQKQARYAHLEARALRERGIRPKPWSFVLQPLREFHRRYVTLQGYREGLLGLQLCALLAWSSFQTYRELARLWRQS